VIPGNFDFTRLKSDTFIRVFGRLRAVISNTLYTFGGSANWRGFVLCVRYDLFPDTPQIHGVQFTHMVAKLRHCISCLAAKRARFGH